MVRLLSALFLLGILPGSAMAQTADGPMDAKAQYAYDKAMVSCVSGLFSSDHEAAAHIYDGVGFEWNDKRDGFMESCMNKAGYKMPGTKISRVGGAGYDDPRRPSPEAVRGVMRKQLLESGGPKAVAEMDAYNAQFENGGKPVTPPPGLPGVDFGNGKAASGATPAPAAGKDAPSGDGKTEKPKRNLIYVPSDKKKEGAKPIWLDIQKEK